jgi:excisionase family DNA binding protein
MKTRIGELCRAVKIENPYQLQKACNFSPSQATRLYKDEVEAISLSVLKTLCNVLQCSPNDITGFDVAPVAPVAPVADKPKQKSKPFVHPGFTEALAESNSGKPFNHSILELSKSSSDNETLLSTEMVAERLGLKLSSIREHYNSGKLPFVKVGKKNKVRESDFIVFRDSRNLKKK